EAADIVFAGPAVHWSPDAGLPLGHGSGGKPTGDEAENKQADGDHEAHNATTGCEHMPQPRNLTDPGYHAICHGAVAEAERNGPPSRINGCACHTSQKVAPALCDLCCGRCTALRAAQCQRMPFARELKSLGGSGTCAIW